ncbi:MAG: antitoxin [Motilibacteraceae bacterium]
MGMFDELKDKAEQAVDAHGEQVGQGLDKAGDLIDERTGGTYSGQIDTGVDKAKDVLDGLDGRDDDIR